MEKEKIFAFAFLAILLMVSMFPIAQAEVSRDNFPRLDELWMVICPTEAVMLIKALGGQIDWAKDLENPANIAYLQAVGWNISANLNYDSGYIFFNCRNVCPGSSGQYYDYYGREPGDWLFPLNISDFRFALQLIIGGEIKQRIISEIFAWTKIPQDAFLSPAYGSAWVPPITSAHDETLALEILNSAGFYNDTAHTGLADGIWANTNPTIGPTGEIRAGFGAMFPPGFEKTIHCLGCPEAATSMGLVTQKFMEEWNRFFGLNSEGNPYFVYDNIPWIEMEKIVYGNRDFDICGLEVPLVGRGMHFTIEGRDPDYVYDVFHPDRDMEWGTNIAGINNPGLNINLQGLKSPAGLGPAQTACQLAQWDIYFLAPCIPLYSKTCVNAFAPSLKCWINPRGYGADNWWSYNWIMWKDLTKTLIRVGVPGPIKTLNPLVANSVYEWEILSRIYDAFIGVNPFRKNDVMWAISSYTMVPWIDTGINAAGFNVTFKIRPGIKWHDGDPFTADDAEWSWEFINNIKPARYADFWEYYVSSEKIDDYTVRCYFNNTGFWYLYDVAGTAMMFRQSVWETFWDNPTGAAAFEPWKVKYDDYVGTVGHGDLTCLVGTGPWVFVEYNEPALFARLMANRPFSIGTWTYTGLYWAGHFSRRDINFDFRIDIDDISRVSAALGAVPGHPRWNDGECDVNCDGVVDRIDLAIVISGYGVSIECDVAITNVTPYKTVVGQGYSMNIKVTAENQGNYFEETFNVTLYAYTTISEPIEVTLTSGNFATVTFTWNTTGFAKGIYTISAVADTVPGETDTTDNTLTDGWVLVTIVGDVNGDCKVDGKDIALIIKAYGSYPGHPKWDPNMDVNCDGKVDGKDIALTIKYYGKYW
jgi:ABC-type transport system substrate-binding protein